MLPQLTTTSAFAQAKPLELELLIAKDHERTFLKDEQTFRPQTASRINAALVHISLILIYALITTAIILRYGLCKIFDSTCNIDPHPFARSAIQYAPRRFIYPKDSPYIGTPSSTIEASWAALLGDANIRVTKVEMTSLGQNLSSISVDSNDNRLAWLEMSHQLHCVKYLREATYPEYYHLNLSEHEAKTLRVHIDHCLNDLLQTVICHANTELKLFGWTAEERKPVIKSNYDEPRMCVDMDHLKAELAPRVVSHEEMQRLRNPLWKNEV